MSGFSGLATDPGNFAHSESSLPATSRAFNTPVLYTAATGNIEFSNLQVAPCESFWTAYELSVDIDQKSAPFCSVATSEQSTMKYLANAYSLSDEISEREICDALSLCKHAE